MVVRHIPLHPTIDAIYLQALLWEYPPIAEDVPHVRLRPAEIIVPGGGYLSIDGQRSEKIALSALAKGNQVFILNYRVGAPFAHLPMPAMDLSEAIAHIDTHAALYGVDSSNLTLVGEGTGAHLIKVFEAQHNHLKVKIRFEHPIVDLITFKTHLLKWGTEGHAQFEQLCMACFGTPYPADELLRDWSYPL